MNETLLWGWETLNSRTAIWESYEAVGALRNEFMRSAVGELTGWIVYNRIGVPIKDTK